MSLTALERCLCTLKLQLNGFQACDVHGIISVERVICSGRQRCAACAVLEWLLVILSRRPAGSYQPLFGLTVAQTCVWLLADGTAAASCALTGLGLLLIAGIVLPMLLCYAFDGRQRQR